MINLFGLGGFNADADDCGYYSGVRFVVVIGGRGNDLRVDEGWECINSLNTYFLNILNSNKYSPENISLEKAAFKIKTYISILTFKCNCNKLWNKHLVAYCLIYKIFTRNLKYKNLLIMITDQLGNSLH